MTDEALKETQCWSTLNGDRCSLEGKHDLHQSATGNCWLDLDLIGKSAGCLSCLGEISARIKALISELATARAELADVKSVMGVQPVDAPQREPALACVDCGQAVAVTWHGKCWNCKPPEEAADGDAEAPKILGAEMSEFVSGCLAEAWQASFGQMVVTLTCYEDGRFSPVLGAWEIGVGESEERFVHRADAVTAIERELLAIKKAIPDAPAPQRGGDGQG